MKQNFLKVKLDRNDAQLALTKKAGSRNREESLAALDIVASIAAPAVLKNILQAPVISNFFKFGYTITENDAPSIPLADYFDVRQRNLVNVWSQSQSGGLVTNQLGAGSDLYFDILDLYSAVSFKKKWLRAGRTESLANGLTKMAQEVLVQRNGNAAYVLLGSLAASRIDGVAGNNAVTNLQVDRTQAANVFQLDDFNRLMTRYRRICSSWVGGTPVGVLADLTDMFGSPEWMQQVRGIAYQPQNTRDGSVTTSGASSIAAPDAVRNEIFNSAGVASLFGINLHVYNEFGDTVAGSYQGLYNQVFADALGAVQPAGYGGGAAATFTAASEQVVVGLNQTMDDLIGLRRSDNPSDWAVSADDQFSARTDTAGFYGQLSEGFASIDSRSKVATIM